MLVIKDLHSDISDQFWLFYGYKYNRRTWNIRLLDLAGNNFDCIKRFHKLIRRQLNKWVGLRNYDAASYWQSFISLSTDIGQLMKVFTLNYDLCFENIVGKEKIIERGFTQETHEWHSSNFDNTSGKHYNLYKLHGSINWYIVNDKLHQSEKIEEDPELIFGIQHKMTSVDPYFYYSSILRIACHDEAKLIVVIGYSYADEYVNIIISQALNMRSELRVINVAPFNISEDAEKKRIAERLKLKNLEQLIVVNATAKDFMTKTMNKDFFVKQIKEPEGSPFDQNHLH